MSMKSPKGRRHQAGKKFGPPVRPHLVDKCDQCRRKKRQAFLWRLGEECLCWDCLCGRPLGSVTAAVNGKLAGNGVGQEDKSNGK